MHPSNYASTSSSILSPTVLPSLVSKAVDVVTESYSLFHNDSTVSTTVDPKIVLIMEQLDTVKRIYEWLIPAMIVILLVSEKLGVQVSLEYGVRR